ncbi:MAG: phenylalanine--tRNA ligase beta subunit-related protein [Candidatus Hydrothermarchaeales archaeon]
MSLDISSMLEEEFPDLKALVEEITGVRVERENRDLESFKEEVTQRVKERYNLAELKDLPIFRVYRNFFWRVGIDPTKVRPAAEALIRRILRGKPLPTINTLVDAYNLASIETKIAIAAFDSDKIEGKLLMRLAEEGEEFLGIGMDRPLILKGNEVVVSDGRKLVAIYPYRDADTTKITLHTRNVLLLICGVPGIDGEILRNTRRVAVDYITKFCGGNRKL